MKRIVAAVAGLVALGSASQALAWTLDPKLAIFTASGTITISSFGNTFPCTANLTGNIDASGSGNITNFTLTGGPLGICSTITVSGIHNFTATGGQAATISDVAFVNPATNWCGPGDLPVTVSFGTITFNDHLPIGCTVTGSLRTIPTVAVVTP